MIRQANGMGILERNLSLMTCVPKGFLKNNKKYINKDQLNKLRIQKDLQWINELFSSNKRQKQPNQTPKLRKYSTKNPIKSSVLSTNCQNPQNHQNNSQASHHEVQISKTNKQNIDSNNSQNNQGRFGILSAKTVVKALDCNQILEHQRKIRELQNHARRMSCQLSGRRVGCNNIPDIDNLDGGQQVLGENNALNTIFNSTQNNQKNLSQQISLEHHNLITKNKKKKLYSRLHHPRSTCKFNHGNKLQTAIELQPWELRVSHTKQIKDEDEELENYLSRLL